MTSGRSAGWRQAALAAAAAVLCGGGAAAGSPGDLYYERSLMVAADARCRLFTPDLASALASAQAQARGAALRAGSDDGTLSQIRARAQAKAGAVACRSPDLSLAAKRVRDAFDGFSRLQRMSYPGELADWQADRGASAHVQTWRLSQPATFGWDRVVFGIGGQGRDTAVMAVASFADGAWPYAARLVIRDPARAPRAQIERLGAAQPSRIPLARRVAPRQASQVILAESRTVADPLLLPKGAQSGIEFRFPAQAATLMQGLDPREAVMLEFAFAGSGRDQIRTAYLEVGDFAAGQAFLTVAQR